MVRKRRRSSSGIAGSRVSASTRRLNSSHDSSRFRYRRGSFRSSVPAGGSPERGTASTEGGDDMQAESEARLCGPGWAPWTAFRESSMKTRRHGMTHATADRVSAAAPLAVACAPWLERLAAAIEVAAKGDDPEGVHQVRVAAGRLVVWLRLGARRALIDDLR